MSLCPHVPNKPNGTALGGRGEGGGGGGEGAFEVCRGSGLNVAIATKMGGGGLWGWFIFVAPSAHFLHRCDASARAMVRRARVFTSVFQAVSPPDARRRDWYAACWTNARSAFALMRFGETRFIERTDHSLDRRIYTMRAGTGLNGLARWTGSAVVAMFCAGITPALAADPPADAKTATEAATSAPSALSLTTSVPSDAEATTAQDPAPAAPSFLQSIEVYGLVDGYYGWAFNKVGPAAAELRHQPQQLQPELRRARDRQAGHRTEPCRFPRRFRCRRYGRSRQPVRAGWRELLEVRAAGLRLVPRAGGQGADRGLRQVRHAGGRRSDREQGQLQLLARPAVRVGDPLLPHGRSLRLRGQPTRYRSPVTSSTAGTTSRRTTTRRRSSDRSP